MRNAHINPKRLNQRWRFEAARRVEGISATEAHLLKELINRGKVEGCCWAKSQTLADDMKVCVKTVERTLKRLASLGLIRYWASIKPDGTKGVRYIAVTLPISQNVPVSGQKGTFSRDTESEHNIKIQHKLNLESYRIPRLENGVFEILKDRLDRYNHPKLICMYELTGWLFKRTGRDWKRLEELVINEAQKLNGELARGKYRLRAWSHFIDRLDEAMGKQGAQLSCIKAAPNLSKRIISELRSLLKPVKGYHSSMLDWANVEVDGEVVLINCRSLFDRDRLQKIGEPALKTLANQEDMPMCFASNGQRSQPINPKSYG